ncbi:hypothetical protein DFJ73DRAFT_826881 [Zopfochytrium polystomum]|nr:hypothetical protein DFJ73DRAFT_826881 [Zopfochytrium polystomum]
MDFDDEPAAPNAVARRRRCQDSPPGASPPPHPQSLPREFRRMPSALARPILRAALDRARTTDEIVELRLVSRESKRLVDLHAPGLLLDALRGHHSFGIHSLFELLPSLYGTANPGDSLAAAWAAGAAIWENASFLSFLDELRETDLVAIHNAVFVIDNEEKRVLRLTACLPNVALGRVLARCGCAWLAGSRWWTPVVAKKVCEELSKAENQWRSPNAYRLLSHTADQSRPQLLIGLQSQGDFNPSGQTLRNQADALFLAVFIPPDTGYAVQNIVRGLDLDALPPALQIWRMNAALADFSICSKCDMFRQAGHTTEIHTAICTPDGFRKVVSMLMHDDVWPLPYQTNLLKRMLRVFQLCSDIPSMPDPAVLVANVLEVAPEPHCRSILKQSLEQFGAWVESEVDMPWGNMQQRLLQSIEGMPLFSGGRLVKILDEFSNIPFLADLIEFAKAL